MKAHQATYPVRVMSRLLGVSASGFYAWLKRAPSRRALQDIALTAKIHAIHRHSGGAYGAPSIHAELADDHGARIGRKRAARLMRAGPESWTITLITKPAEMPESPLLQTLPPAYRTLLRPMLPTRNWRRAGHHR